MKKINVESIKKFIGVCYAVYCVAYIVAAMVTLVVLYRDEIATFVKKVARMSRRILLKLTCFFKQLNDKVHRFDTDSNYEVEFACSEE